MQTVIDLLPIKEKILADAKKDPGLRRAMGRVQAHEATVAWLLDYCAKAMIERDALRRGEFVCMKCGLRKDSDPPSTAPDF